MSKQISQQCLRCIYLLSKRIALGYIRYSQKQCCSIPKYNQSNKVWEKSNLHLIVTCQLTMKSFTVSTIVFIESFSTASWEDYQHELIENAIVQDHL
ncbi:hypothetical protein FGO68_gene17735 [Halteria grandinella]|uniref:Uncharacterized protein n=1 Tax=Halteria grandinella TaxID=5974 RepID=A0A8J8NBN2_HALGN|nr:hypothetical protein FGO68_gene17735 [Halteria grandinella]